MMGIVTAGQDKDWRFFSLKYVGCLEINTPMKSLDFDTRSKVAKECINRVCEASGLKTVDKKRRQDKRICRMLAEKPNMDNAGSNVNLEITSSYLKLSVMETGEVIAKHEMPNISFASGGDADTLDFVAYVAKDDRFIRACFVLECGGGKAQDVISTIGQAFELRFKEFLKKQPHKASIQDRFENKRTPMNGLHGSINHHHQMLEGAVGGEERDYYNDMPGKVPPDLPERKNDLRRNDDLLGKTQSQLTSLTSSTSSSSRSCIKKFNTNSISDHSPNLIDLTSDLQISFTTNDTFPKAKAGNLYTILPSTSSTLNRKFEPEYVNCNPEEQSSRLISTTSEPDTGSGPSFSIKDPFDMQPFCGALENFSTNLESDPILSSSSPIPSHTSFNMEGSEACASLKPKSLQPTNPNDDLTQAEWFHGAIGRRESEMLVVHDGDFLVRESLHSPGKYVLTGMQGGLRKHFTLVDPEGVVRTKACTFESVTHLINYYRDNGLPLMTADSELVLLNPIIHRPQSGRLL